MMNGSPGSQPENAGDLKYAAQHAFVFLENHKDPKETMCINNILQNVSIFKDEASDSWEQ